jgi:hypothetical protein
MSSIASGNSDIWRCLGTPINYQFSPSFTYFDLNERFKENPPRNKAGEAFRKQVLLNCECHNMVTLKA